MLTASTPLSAQPWHLQHPDLTAPGSFAIPWHKQHPCPLWAQATCPCVSLHSSTRMDHSHLQGEKIPCTFSFHKCFFSCGKGNKYSKGLLSTSQATHDAATQTGVRIAVNPHLQYLLFLPPGGQIYGWDSPRSSFSYLPGRAIRCQIPSLLQEILFSTNNSLLPSTSLGIFYCHLNSSLALPLLLAQGLACSG